MDKSIVGKVLSFLGLMLVLCPMAISLFVPLFVFTLMFFIPIGIALILIGEYLEKKSSK